MVLSQFQKVITYIFGLFPHKYLKIRCIILLNLCLGSQIFTKYLKQLSNSDKGIGQFGIRVTLTVCLLSVLVRFASFWPWHGMDDRMIRGFRLNRKNQQDKMCHARTYKLTAISKAMLPHQNYSLLM